MKESRLAEAIVRHAKALYDRGLTHGSTGNISVRLADGWLMTPTGTSFGHLDPARLSRLGPNGELLSRDVPTKEAVLHRAMYDARPASGAVVHLHSTHSVAMSMHQRCQRQRCAAAADRVVRHAHRSLAPGAVLPAQRRATGGGRAGLRRVSSRLRADHGPVVAGVPSNLRVDAIEELEATARLHLLLRHERCRALTPTTGR